MNYLRDDSPAQGGGLDNTNRHKLRNMYSIYNTCYETLLVLLLYVVLLIIANGM